MFRSARRAVVYPQAEHAVFAGMIALAWGNEHSPLPPLPIDSFVRGVALHDRGYGELDVDEIGSVAGSRWVDTQRAGFGNHDSNPVVDLVASMHVCRLVSNAAEPEAKSAHAEMTPSCDASASAPGWTSRPPLPLMRSPISATGSRSTSVGRSQEKAAWRSVPRSCATGSTVWRRFR